MSDANPSVPGPPPATITGDRSGGSLYRERLWPGPWVWLCAAAAAVMLGVAYGAALGATLGWVVAGCVAVAAGSVVWATSPTVEVRADELRLDRAALPWWASGRVLVLDATGVRRARGPEGDHTAYSVVRPGLGSQAVVIEVTDPADPHATWLIGSRDAEAMARAIHEARGRLTP